MEEKFMGIATLVITFLTILICFLLIYIPDVHTIATAFNDEHILYVGRESVLERLKENEDEAKDYSASLQEKLKGHQLRLKLPKNISPENVSIESDYVNKLTSIKIKGVGKTFFDDMPMVGNADHIVDVTYDSEHLLGTIGIVTDEVLELTAQNEDNFVYFDFVHPKDMYDKVVVIDAGHGGSVPGATKQGISEKDIDLAIVLKLKELFEKNGNNIKVYYTRTEDKNPSFANRVGLANDSDADLFLSIHNNSTASGRMSSISGTEVMYKGGDSTGESKKFAEICRQNLLNDLKSKDKGTVVGDDIYIIRESDVPVALVEVGFMTNKAELANLCDEDYQEKCARSLYDSIMEYLYK